MLNSEDDLIAIIDSLHRSDLSHIIIDKKTGNVLAMSIELHKIAKKIKSDIEEVYKEAT